MGSKYYIKYAVVKQFLHVKQFSTCPLLAAECISTTLRACAWIASLLFDMDTVSRFLLERLIRLLAQCVLSYSIAARVHNAHAFVEVIARLFRLGEIECLVRLLDAVLGDLNLVLPARYAVVLDVRPGSRFRMNWFRE